MTQPTPPTPFDIAPEVLTERFGGRRCEVTPGLRRALDAICPTSTDAGDLAEHARDWWPIAIGWAAAGEVPALPGLVVSPRNADEVAAVLAACTSASVSVTPSAGRSGVCGGTIPLLGGVSLDLCGLNQILEVDEESLLVTVEAGVFGPDLEAHLGSIGEGYTVGHFPQSFALATVGGWLACRGAGQYSTRYGKIEDMVVGLTVALADGRIITTEGGAPRQAVGPNLTQFFVGSEGTLGVITSATLRIHPKPAAEARRAASFATFGEGLEAIRRILRRGATPAVVRLYDEIESKRTFEVDANVLIVLDEADPLLLDATMAIVDEEIAQATALEDRHVAHWLEHRNNVDQLAPLWRNHIVVDTIEIAGRWRDLDQSCTAVLEALRGVPGTMVASVHESHAYPDGACLYFTFVGRPEPIEGEDLLAAEQRYYDAAWDAANAVLIERGCAISHHHGIGYNRSRFVAPSLGAAAGVLAELKATLDPAGIMNPGKLGFALPG